MGSLWVKDQNGNPNVVVTLVAVSFVTTTVAYVLSIVDHIGSISIRPFDVGAASAYFGAVLAAYVGHTWVGSKYSPGNGPASNAPTPPTGG